MRAWFKQGQHGAQRCALPVETGLKFVIREACPGQGHQPMVPTTQCTLPPARKKESRTTRTLPKTF